MTPNKLPPLPKHASKGPWPGDPAFYTADQMHAYAAEALRQSQSLPAGAVAEIGELNGTKLIVGRNEEALASLPKGTKLYALQADAREKGEAVAWECKMVGRDVGWHACTKEQFENIRLTGFYNGPGGARCEARELFATQPAQASEKDNG